MELHRYVIHFALSALLCTSWARSCVAASGSAVEINLNKTCVNEQLSACSISEINATFDTPLVVVNASAPELRELVLRNSIIRLLPTGVFRQAPQLNTFVVYNCGVYRLHAEDFRNASQLTKLLLQKNRISRLTDKNFSWLTKLQTLELGYNTIHTLQKNTFANLTQLTYLGMQSNGIRALVEDIFKPLENLQHLDVSGNEIEEINALTFRYNTKLETLLLNGNQFIVFESNALSHLSQLHLLDLSNCALQELIVDSVDTLLLPNSGAVSLIINGRVLRLHASNNELAYVSVAEPTAVMELDLHGNVLKSADLLRGMTSLQRLDLSKNLISKLCNQCLALPSLTHLNLAANKLEALSADTLLMLPRLIQLDVSFNHLLRLGADAFEPLSNLEKLFVEGNRLHDFDYEAFLRNHARLKELGIYDNDWEFQFMRKMTSYLSDHGIRLLARYQKHTEADGALPMLAYNHNEPMWSAQAQHVGVAGIHPYWTRRDVFALVTLVAVFAILLLLLWRILQEEGCFSRCRLRTAVGALNGSVARQSAQRRPRRLNEEDTEV